jgi:hypothetical protein
VTARPTFSHEGDFNFTWGFYRDFDLTVLVPVVTNHFASSGNGGAAVRGTGIGDAMVLIKYRFYRRDSPRPFGPPLRRAMRTTILAMPRSGGHGPLRQDPNWQSRFAGRFTVVMGTFFSAQSAAAAVSDLRARSEKQLIAAAKSGRRAFFRRALRTS